jgi:hypothetical protein
MMRYNPPLGPNVIIFRMRVDGEGADRRNVAQDSARALARPGVRYDS